MQWKNRLVRITSILHDAEEKIIIPEDSNKNYPKLSTG